MISAHYNYVSMKTSRNLRQRPKFLHLYKNLKYLGFLKRVLHAVLHPHMFSRYSIVSIDMWCFGFGDLKSVKDLSACLYVIGTAISAETL